MSNSDSNKPLVVVFHAGDPGVLPLAEASLEREGIEYLIRARGGRVPVGFGHTAEFGGAEGPSDILVSEGDADRAIVVLSDLALAPDALGQPPQEPVRSAAAPLDGPRAYQLTEVDSGTMIGNLTEGQLEFLVQKLEEESDSDRDYYIDAATIDMLADAGADTELIAMLKRALGSREGVEIAWTKL